MNSTYTFIGHGAGFDVNCSWVDGAEYDLAPTEKRQRNGGQIFSSAITWEADEPNNIYIDVSYKIGAPCKGKLWRKKCTLRAATVEYATQVQMTVEGTPYLGPFFSLQRHARDIAGKTIKILPVDPREGKDDQWTYSGIATSLAWTFNATMNTYDYWNGSGGATSTGSFATSLNPNWYSDTLDYYYCNLDFTNGLSSVNYYQFVDSDTIDPGVLVGEDPVSIADPVELIVNRLRQAMFLVSVYTVCYLPEHSPCE